MSLPRLEVSYIYLNSEERARFAQTSQEYSMGILPTTFNHIITRDEKFERIKTVFIEEFKQLEINNDMLCTICYENYNEITEISILQCSHNYHKNCLKKWICDNNKNNCPYCRKNIEELK